MLYFNEFDKGRAEDFRIGVALFSFMRKARKIFLIATPKFLSATPYIQIFVLALG